MKYNLTVFLNRVSCILDPSYFAKHGVDLHITYKNCDVSGYGSVYEQINGRWGHHIHGLESLVSDPTADAIAVIVDLEEWKSAPGAQFPLRPDTPTGSTFLFNGKPFIVMPVYKGNVETYPHEIMHALRFSANQAGFSIQDVMDTYREDANPDSPTGNFAEQWALLKPYLKSLQSPPSLSIPKVVVTRAWDDGTQYLGDLAFGDFKCKTVELPWKLNVPNISCIPRGLYTCKWTWSFRFLRYTYEVQNVSGRSGIRIHPANFFFDLKGCIALGDKYGDLNHDKWADLINSKETISKFEQLMNKRPFQLIIV